MNFVVLGEQEHEARARSLLQHQMKMSALMGPEEDLEVDQLTFT